MKSLVPFEVDLKEDNFLHEKSVLDAEYAELERHINDMIFDLSNDYPELVLQFNSLPNQESTFKPKDSDLSQIWRLIALKCHPDKNTKRDPVLHSLFIQAKKQKEDGSLAQLYFTYLEVVKHTKDKSSLCRMIDKQKLEESLLEIEQRLEQLRASFMGQLLIVYCINRGQASRLYRDFILSRIQESKVKRESHE